MSDGKKKARKVTATLRKALAEILVTVISAVGLNGLPHLSLVFYPQRGLYVKQF